METKFLSKLVYEAIIGTELIRLIEPFRYYSKLLNKIIEIPAGFVCDLESVPLLRGTSPRGGIVHDYFCRIDSNPIVTKQKAASLYIEAQACKDELVKEKESGFSKYFYVFGRFIRRHFKTLVVRVAPGYFHKHKVMDPVESFY